MAENAIPAPASGAADSVDRAKEKADYDGLRQTVRKLLSRKHELSRNLSQHESKIFDLETKYIESTPSGNILTGFDNYTKGITGAAASRRKTGATEQNRVFSRSSISYNTLNQDSSAPGSGTSTPVGAPTPLSTSFANKDKEGAGTNAPTPTSATDKKAALSKKRKEKEKEKEKEKATEDSESDAREVKKVRTNFGAAGRK